MQREEVMKFVESLGHEPNEVKSVCIEPYSVRVEKFALDLQGEKQLLLDGGSAVHVVEHMYDVEPNEDIYKRAKYAVVELEELQDEFPGLIDRFTVNIEKGFDNTTDYGLELCAYWSYTVDESRNAHNECMPYGMAIMPVHDRVSSLEGVDNLIMNTREGLKTLQELMD